jgi:3-hydroxyisobutyrate dehydrogenase-like beta-hydroxyacid dehydrogenase
MSSPSRHLKSVIARRTGAGLAGGQAAITVRQAEKGEDRMADVIGVIGAGIMGGAMVLRLLERGFDVIVHDTDPDRMEPCLAAGAIAAAGARDVADRADIVLCSLPSPKVSLAVAADVIGTSRAAVYIETSTIGSPAITQISELLARHGLAVVDAPVSGGGFAIAEGRLTMFVAGPAAAVRRIQPVLQALSSTIFELGDQVGRGQFCKIINNGIGMAGLVAACEGLAAASQAGIPPERMIDILNAGSAANWATMRMLPNTMLAGKPSGAMAITVKDVGLYLAEADFIGAKIPVAAGLFDRLKDAVAHGDPQRDTTELYSYFIDLAKQ